MTLQVLREGSLVLFTNKVHNVHKFHCTFIVACTLPKEKSQPIYCGAPVLAVYGDARRRSIGYCKSHTMIAITARRTQRVMLNE